jgi:hypothetical protein
MAGFNGANCPAQRTSRAATVVTAANGQMLSTKSTGNFAALCREVDGRAQVLFVKIHNKMREEKYGPDTVFSTSSGRRHISLSTVPVERTPCIDRASAKF